ncbi:MULTISPECIES: response regulator transcription factor [unclassified Corynebacterium]|uniref:response regulator transcription factor n=1 Tax=unclassified Corynebacterium TaxID=2624378 RepID=UPI0008A2F9FB|nr:MULTISPECIES: response regulator transcription factor [unclassified Corynebacterium]OFP37155.1 DNA-binding response regulator [Corynebacterium sp. HMSC071B10]OHF40423.1 DNA-binding response regulator [Corynebacterium sp. HMSC074A01]
MKIVVADDSALLREGVAGLLTRRGHDIVGEASSADELISLIDAAPLPDLLITDVRMPPHMRDDGLTAALELRTRHPGLNVLVLSQYVAAPYARELFGQNFGGGTGYLLKDRVAEVADFIATCENVAGGGVVIDPEVASSLMHTSAPWLRELSPRELEVLELMAEGLSNADISAKLFLSSAAVAKHVSSIFSKLGLTPDEDNRRVRAILMFLSERGVD